MLKLDAQQVSRTYVRRYKRFSRTTAQPDRYAFVKAQHRALVLASASPRRKDILEQLGLTFR